MLKSSVHFSNRIRGVMDIKEDSFHVDRQYIYVQTRQIFNYKDCIEIIIICIKHWYFDYTISISFIKFLYYEI